MPRFFGFVDLLHFLAENYVIYVRDIPVTNIALHGETSKRQLGADLVSGARTLLSVWNNFLMNHATQLFYLFNL